MEPPVSQYEAERRWLVSDKEEVYRRLAQQGAILIGESYVKDDWFVPASIQTRRQHDNWLRTDRAAPTRIRTIQDNARSSIRLEVKRPVVAGEYNVSREISIGVSDGALAKEIIEALGLRCLITLEKRRKTFRIDDLCEGNVDEYSDGSTILELEVLSTDRDVKLPVALGDLGETLANGIAVLLVKSAAIYFIDRKLSNRPL
jgi:predicted adenylyl cyclase CyaB